MGHQFMDLFLSELEAGAVTVRNKGVFWLPSPPQHPPLAEQGAFQAHFQAAEELLSWQRF